MAAACAGPCRRIARGGRRMRSVLVTGAAGFVGRHLVSLLTAHGARVTGIGVEADPPALPLEAWHAVDLRELDPLLEALGGHRLDAVVHLAGQSSAARSFEDPLATFQANVLGTWNLLEAFRRAAPRARLLVVGSSEAYGPQPPGDRVAESAPFAPVSPYALSKAVADSMAEAHARGHGLDVIRVRAFSHTGPGQGPAFVIPAFARQIAELEAHGAEPVLRVGNLEVTRDLTDVRDVVLAYLALLERGTSGAAYNVCRGEGIRLAELVRRLVAMARVEVRIEQDPSRLRPADVPWLVGDPGRIARDVGWRAEIPLEETLQGVLDEWRARASGEGTGPA
jgi:GDP-4-dehydro-6-deoxy-D-mannose reductase